MSLWLLSQNLPPLCRPSTVEVQRWSEEVPWTVPQGAKKSG